MIRKILQFFGKAAVCLGEGIATIASFGSYPFHSSKYAERFGSDGEMIAKDWLVVGGGIRQAIDNSVNELIKKADE